MWGPLCPSLYRRELGSEGGQILGNTEHVPFCRSGVSKQEEGKGLGKGDRARSRAPGAGYPCGRMDQGWGISGCLKHRGEVLLGILIKNVILRETETIVVERARF